MVLINGAPVNVTLLHQKRAVAGGNALFSGNATATTGSLAAVPTHAGFLRALQPLESKGLLLSEERRREGK